MIRGTPAPQPDWLHGELAQTAYTRAREAAEACPALIWWNPNLAANLAMYAQCYIHAVHEGRPAAELEGMRLCARGWLASFLLINADEVAASGTIRADGVDADIAAACGVPALQ